MAMVQLVGGTIWPSHTSWTQSVGVRRILDAATDRIAAVFMVPKTGTLAGVVFRTNTVAQDTNGLTVSLQNVDVTTGFPDTTEDQSTTVAATSSDTWHEATTLTRAVTAGDILCIEIRFTNFQTGDDVDIAHNDSDQSENPSGATCYGVADSAGSYGFQGAIPCFALKYNDGSYEPISANQGAWYADSQVSFNNADTPDEYAMRFQVPMACESRGAYFNVDLDGNAEIVLYEGTTEKGAASLDDDVRPSTAPGGFLVYWPEGAITLATSTTYYLALKPTTTTDVKTLRYILNSSAGEGYPGGSQFYQGTRVNAGSWTDSTAFMPQCGILITAVDDGAGGGSASGARNPLRIV